MCQFPAHAQQIRAWWMEFHCHEIHLPHCMVSLSKHIHFVTNSHKFKILITVHLNRISVAQQVTMLLLFFRGEGRFCYCVARRAEILARSVLYMYRHTDIL